MGNDKRQRTNVRKVQESNRHYNYESTTKGTTTATTASYSGGGSKTNKDVEQNCKRNAMKDKSRVLRTDKRNRNTCSDNKKYRKKESNFIYQKTAPAAQQSRRNCRHNNHINASTTVYPKSSGPIKDNNKSLQDRKQRINKRNGTQRDGNLTSRTGKNSHGFNRHMNSSYDKKQKLPAESNPPKNVLTRRCAKISEESKADSLLDVYLNIYKLDLVIPVNAYHSAIEIAGLEYAYGANVGVYACQPGEGYGARNMLLREKILLGQVKTSAENIYTLMRMLARSEFYAPSSYNLLNRNCNDFTEDCARILKVKAQQPYYVNALAKSGRFLGCVRGSHGIDYGIENNKLRNRSWISAFCS